MKNLNWIIVVFTFLVIKPGFGDDLFQYSLRAFPKNANAKCDESAKELAKRFSTVTGKPVFRGYCDADTSKGYDISVIYRAEKPVSYMSTKRELDGRGDFGTYVTQTDCQNNLTQEIRWFEDGTGLNHFVAYCYKEQGSNKTPYAAYVDGFGSAKQFPYRYQKNIYGEIIGGAVSSLMKELPDLALSTNIKVNIASMAHDGSYKLVVRYYDSPENDIFRSDYFSVTEMAQFYSDRSSDTQANCLYSSQESLKKFSSEFTEGSVKFCVWDPTLFRAILYVVHVKPQLEFETQITPFRFTTFAQCESERDAIVDYYQTELKKNVVGGLCSWQSGFGTGQPDSFRIQVFINEKK